MSDHPIDRLEAAAQRAEDAWRRGDFVSAFQYYANAVGERLATSGYGIDSTMRLEAADFVVFERLSDLARLFGRGSEADELLAITIDQISTAGNDYWADLLRVKRIDLALGRKRLRAAQSLLHEMSPSIGDVTRISFTSSGLREWEKSCHWLNADERDRATIFVLLSFVMGRLLAALGQYGEAEAAFRNGLTHALHNEDAGSRYRGPQELAKQAILPLKLALANALLEKGEIQRAASHLKQFRGQIDQQLQPAIFVQALELEGKLSLFAGDFGAALRCFRKVLELCRQRNFVIAAVAATLNLAHILILMNQTLDARSHLMYARTQAQACGDLAFVARAEWLLQLCSARTQSLADGVPVAQTVTEQWEQSDTDWQDPSAGADPGGTIDSREAHERRTFAGSVNPFDLPQSDNYLSFFEERALALHWLLGRRDFIAGAVYLAQLQNIFATTDSLLIKLRLQVLSGLVAYYQLNFEQAEKLLLASQPELRRLGLVPELWQLQRILGWCRLKLGLDERAQEQLTAENANLLSGMTDTLAPEDRPFFLLNKWTAEEEHLAFLINQLSRMKEELASVPWYLRWRRSRRLRLQIELLLRVLDRYRDITARRTSQPSDSTATDERSVLDANPSPRPSLWRRLRQYKWRHATISFLVLPDRVLVVYRDLFRLNFGVSPATRLEVRNLVRQWHEIVAQITQEHDRGLGKEPSQNTGKAREVTPLIPNPVEESRQLAERLGALLQLPSVLKGLRRPTRNLTLVLDDCLHGFPFAAITHDGRYLIERYALSFAYADLPTAPRIYRARKVLLVGASRGNAGWEPLRFVPKELDIVEDWARAQEMSLERFDDSTPEYATPDKTRILAALPQAAIAHIACHGLFTPDRPAQSGIVLRPTKQPELLTVQELSATDLSNVQHVTLSACWSADHFILPGRWVISLPETLARAGAASVLGCLWLVDDRIGTAFMAKFYHHLNKHTRAEALRRTQLACLKGKLEVADAANAAHPIFWAGYQLYGRSDRLKL